MMISQIEYSVEVVDDIIIGKDYIQLNKNIKGLIQKATYNHIEISNNINIGVIVKIYANSPVSLLYIVDYL